MTGFLVCAVFFPLAPQLAVAPSGSGEDLATPDATAAGAEDVPVSGH